MPLHKGLFALCCVALWSALTARAADPDYTVGVYYFPGWKTKAPGALIDYPWMPIKPYPEREPLLGWYNEGDVDVMEQQLSWMFDYGIDFVAFDWYWNARNQTYLDHAVQAYRRSHNRALVRYALLWANEAQARVPASREQFETMVRYWIANYFRDPEYVKIGGRPVVFIFSVEMLRNNAAGFGATVGQLLAGADAIARQAGLPGIYFVAGTEAVEYWVKGFNPQNGFSALSAYNYHRGFSGVYEPLKLYAWSYPELDRAYQQSWDWILKASTLPYFVPVTAGWDKRPWGGSLDPMHDRCSSTPARFREHLLAAKQRIDAYPAKSMNTLMICCWNEYGEGSYIEPTRRYQFQYLEAVRAVFGSRRPKPPELNAITP